MVVGRAAVAQVEGPEVGVAVAEVALWADARAE